MNDTSRSTLRLALSLADQDTADALAGRRRTTLLAALSERLGLPAELVGELLGQDPGRFRAALAVDPVEWLTGAAELGDPVIGRALWDAEYLAPEGHRARAVLEIPDLLETLLCAADLSDARWYDEDGLIFAIQEQAHGPLLIPVLTSGLPGLVLSVLVGYAQYLPPAVVVDCCYSLWDLWGGTEPFTRILDLYAEKPDLDPGHDWLPDLLRGAVRAADPEAYLRERRPEGWEDPEHLLAILTVRFHDGPSQRPEGLDWELVRREHQRLPLDGPPRHWWWIPSPLVRLAQWEGCPTDLVLASYRERASDTVQAAAPTLRAALDKGALEPADLQPFDLWHLMREGVVDREWPLHAMTPAEKVLSCYPMNLDEEALKALRHLLDPLGTDPANWLTFYARLGRAKGSVAALVAEVLATDPEHRNTRWPRPQEARFPLRHPSGARATFLRTLAYLAEEVQVALAPFLDVRGAGQLLAFYGVSPRVRTALIAPHGQAAQRALAYGRQRTEEELEYLLDLDDPQVDAELFRRRWLDDAERERMLAGRLRRGGTRPVPAELLTVLDEMPLADHREKLLIGLDSGDLGVALRVLGRLRLHLPSSQLRVLVAVWERRGPDAVRDLLALDRLPKTLRRRTERLLEEPDGLRQLRAHLAEETSPARRLAYLTAAPAQARTRLRRLRGEGVRPPWPELVAAHAAGPLPTPLLTALAEQPDCPPALLRGALAALPKDGAEWLGSALEDGRLTREDLLLHGAPADAAVAALWRYTEDRSQPATWRPVLRRARALTREHLGSDARAWSEALHRLPTFAGTLPELLAAVGRAEGRRGPTR